MGRIILPDQYTLSKGETGARIYNTVDLNIGVAGYYRCEVTKSRTGKLKYDSGWFKNIITDRGLVEYWNIPKVGGSDNGSIGGICSVGTGNATPLVSDVALANWRADAIGTGGFTPDPNVVGYVAQVSTPGNPSYVPPYWFARYVYQFDTGAAAGNLTEVGAHPSNMSHTSDMFSRSLIVDDDGNPTAITVLSDEILTVTWELRYYLDVTDHAFTFNLNGTPITGTYRLCQAATQRVDTGGITYRRPTINTYSNGTLGDVLTGRPTGQLGFINESSPTGSPIYTQFVNDISNSGTCYADTKGTFAAGNGTGTIQAFTYENHIWAFQFGALSAGIPKTSGQQLQVAFRQIWGRFTG